MKAITLHQPWATLIAFSASTRLPPLVDAEGSGR